MTRKLLTISAGAVFAVLSSTAWAAGPNDGPKYPNSASNKQYQDQRIMDHNNAAPRYPVTSSNKQYTDQRIMDHNNAAPRYAATAKQTAAQTAGVRSPRYTVRSTHRRVITGNHG